MACYYGESRGKPGKALINHQIWGFIRGVVAEHGFGERLTWSSQKNCERFCLFAKNGRSWIREF